MTSNSEDGYDLELEKVSEDEAHVKGAKRQRIPYHIHWTCPECGERRTQDLAGQRYLSYPTWGEEMEHTLYCGPCMEETHVVITPDISIEVEVKPK